MHKFARVLFSVLCLAGASEAFSGPQTYYLLAPETFNGDLKVVSLEPANTITVGNYQLTLDQYQRASIPNSVLYSGVAISGTKSFSLGSEPDATDLLVPSQFAGTSFAIPHITGQHRYYLMTTVPGGASATLTVGASTTNVTLTANTVIEVDGGSNNTLAARITASANIYVAHVGVVAGAVRDAFPVPPAASTVVGIRSQNVTLAASANSTSVTVYASDGTSSAYNLNAGEQVVVTTGANTAQGQGSALRIDASNPVMAVQHDDGDGNDATAFWPISLHTRRLAIPVNAQYVAVACTAASVNVTLYRGTTAPDSQTCSGSATNPGKVFFGSATNGANIPAGWYVIASADVYVAYEAATPNDEHNLLGVTLAAGPTAPALTAPAATTTSNPLAISGTAVANAPIRIFVNNRVVATGTASGAGAFSINTPLVDGANVIYATALSGSDESAPSIAVSTTYTNNIARTQSGTISVDTVWTPGSPATPYVIAANLTVAAGAQLTLQPGATLKFANGVILASNGTLSIKGEPGNPVTLTCNAATCTKGIWAGIDALAATSNVVIENATIEWAVSAVEINGGIAKIRNSTIRNFSADGLLLKNVNASTLVANNLIDNLNDTNDCIEVNNASPTITGNTIQNCSYGIYVFLASSPTVNGNNVITSNVNGVRVAGNNTQNPQPVVTGNQIYGNSNYDYQTLNFQAATNLVLNATGNWWGTTDLTAISNKIYDVTENYTNPAGYPSVNYASPLNAPNGTSVAGNYLIGALAATSTTLTAGATYQVIGTVFVPATKTLTIPGGTVLRFHGADTHLVVDGTLNVQGTSGNLATLTSGRTTPVRGNWPGIRLRANGSVIDYAQIEWAGTAVNATGFATTVRNSTIRYFSSDGILISGAGATSSVIQNNLIDNLNDTQDCIEVNSASPTITGNTLQNCAYGISVILASSPTVNGNNVIASNGYGLRISGNGSQNPQPVVTGNQIYGNTNYDVYTQSFQNATNLMLNATGNWWGTTDLTAISNKIYDLNENYTSPTTYPTVNFATPLDAPNGTPMAGNYLQGALIAASTTLTAGATYQVLGTLFVPATKTLTIPGGTVLRFHGNDAHLVVDGILNVQGTSGNLATLTSGRTTPVRGDWPGIRLRANGSVIDYAQIEWAGTAVNATGFAVSVRNSTIRYFSSDGILISGAGASSSVIHNNLIDNLNDSQDCIEVNNASPTITGNTIQNCTYGISVFLASSPTVNGNNVITSNGYGLRISGNGSQNPQPVVTGNQIYGNTNYDIFTQSFLNATNLVLNATGNWWGTTDLTAISNKIYDLNENYTSPASYPIVNFSSPLDAPNGTPMAGNYLLGALTATSTTLTAGATYEVLGTLFVPATKTLTIPGGTVVRFHGNNTHLLVDGTLNLQGTSGNLATLTSGRTTPVRGDWPGIRLRASGSVIDYAQIEWAGTAVNATGFAVTVRNSTIRYFSSDGILISGAGATSSVIQNNLIDNLNDTGDCIEANNASPSITGNTLQNCANGISVILASSPTVNGNNVITSNGYGLQVSGNGTQNPQPVVTGNQIYGNTNFDIYTQSFLNATNLVLNATGNWWGTTDLTAISNKIFELTDYYTSPATYPTVNFSSPLDAPNGTPISGNYVFGRLSTNTTWSAATNYSAISTVFVPAGVTLTIQPGAVVSFHHPQMRLVVDGTLNIQGTAANPVRLTSSSVVPSRNDWIGVLFRSTSVNSVIDFATLEWVNQAVETETTNVVIRNSTFREYNVGAIRMTATSASTITNNLIDNVDRRGTGIHLIASSPVITGNRIYRNQYGMFLTGASSPAISGNAIAFNSYGIYLDGSGSNSASAVPNPVITGNDIFSNEIAQLQLTSYGASNPVVVNATANYWGVSTPVAGQQIVTSGGTPAAAVNFSGWSSTPLTGPNAGTIVISQIYFSPNGDGVKDVTAFSGNLNATANWTVNVRSPSQSIVRSFTGTGTGVSATWDGRDGAGALLPDSTYSIDLQIPASPSPITLAASSVVLDTVAPTTAITNPAGSSSVQNMVAVPVLGTASDPYFINYFLEYGAGTTPSTWTQISTQTTGVVANTLGTWTVSSIDGTGGLVGGPYTLRLRTNDRAGNAAAFTTPLTLNQLTLSAINISNASFKPIVNETTSIGFTLSAPATVALRVFPESGGPMVREITEVFSTAGAKFMAWNGRDGSGAIVPDEAYVLRLFATAGALNAAYDPPTPANNVGSGSGTVDTFFDTRRNDDWSMGYSMAQPGRVRMTVTPSGGTAFYPINWKPYLAGVHSIIWDGRDPLGNIVTGAVDVYFDAPIDLKPGSVVTVASALPTVYYYTGSSDFLGNSTMSASADFVSLIYSYDQQAKFNYFVDQDSWVSIKVLPPGISDPNSAEAVIVKASALVAKDQLDTVTWTGFLPTDTNNIMWGGADGFWTVILRAQSVATGGVRTLRGSLYLAH